MKSSYAVVLAALLTGPWAVISPVSAQTMAASTPSTPSMSADMTEGDIRKINKDTGKLTIKHGAIKNLNMPPMTMVFTAKDPAMLDKLAVGDKVRFVVVEEAGKMVITELRSAP